MQIFLIFTLTIISYVYFRRYIILQTNSKKDLEYLPSYYSLCGCSWLLIANLIFIFSFQHLILNQFILNILIFAFSLSVIFIARKKLKPSFNARNHFERIMLMILKLAAILSISITGLIIISIIFEALRFFQEIPFFDFIFGLKWSPQISIRPDQVGASGQFGLIPIMVGTLLITIIAMFIAAPIGLISAIYLSEYASKPLRKYAKPIIEILAGIPTVVYGYFAAFAIAPFLKDFFAVLNISASSESALAAGLVMGIMIIPFVLSLSDDVINSVPESLRTASYGIGATKSEKIRKVVIPTALPGIIGSMLLAISRAIGETMIVTMAAGLTAKLTINPLDSVTTATAQIVTLLVGDQEFDSVKTLAAFALGITLFVITLILNIIALLTVKKYQEKYD